MVKRFAQAAAVTGMLVFASGACSTILGVDFDAPRLASADGGDEGGGGACRPKSCAEQGFVCGTQNDTCGTPIECGVCPGSGVCSNGKCACKPKTCPEIGATCGVVDDGCGASLDCGTCRNATDACVANKCQCQPKNCTARGATCGTIPDGCGNTYDCGTCAGNPAGPNCGGAGPNKCGMNACVPLTCAGRCGDVSDGCGAVLKCPGCAAPQTCGGGGKENVCGCTPSTCAQQGKNCGTVNDGCGGTVACPGSCVAPQTCGGGGTPNVCGCTPLAACPPGKNCGTIPNGCGGNVACGPACVAPQTCGGGGSPNVCGCTPLTCDSFPCGIRNNGCGGTINCGTCTACFPAGTQIAMAAGGTKPIESVVAGDRVLSPDPETGAVTIVEVAERKQHAAALSRAGIVAIDGALRATRNHPIWVNGKVAPIEEIRVGDTIMIADPNGGFAKRRVESVSLEAGGETTYDLVLVGGSTYVANGLVVQVKQ